MANKHKNTPATDEPSAAKARLTRKEIEKEPHQPQVQLTRL